jgi:hypothetical protein
LWPDLHLVAAGSVSNSLDEVAQKRGLLLDGHGGPADVGIARLPLSVKRVEVLVQAFVC